MSTVLEFPQDAQYRRRRLPWFTFVVFTLAFFIALHDASRSFSIEGDYLPSEDTLKKHASEGNARRQIGFVMAGAFGVLLLIRPDRRPLVMNGFLAALILFFLTWMVLSISWADERALTARRLVVIAMLALGALGVATQMTPREITLFVLFCSMAYLIAGIASEVALGTFTPSAERYRFSGTIHPNNQGVNCSLILLSSAAAAQSEKRWRKLFVCCAGAAMVFLLLTKSRTSLLSFLITFGAYCILVYGRSRHFAYVCSLLITAGLLAALLANGTIMPALEHGILLGRDDQDLSGAMSLTGRLPLWQNLLEYAAERPIQGYGYGSFFTLQHIREITATQGWPIAECHSVFLEVLMGLGIVGVTSYTLIQFIGIGRSVRYFRITRDPNQAFLGSLLILGVVGGLAESTLLVPTMQTFVQFMTLAYFAFQAAPEAVRKHVAAADQRKFSSPPIQAGPPLRPIVRGDKA